MVPVTGLSSENLAVTRAEPRRQGATIFIARAAGAVARLCAGFARASAVGPAHTCGCCRPPLPGYLAPSSGPSAAHERAPTPLRALSLFLKQSRFQNIKKDLFSKNRLNMASKTTTLCLQQMRCLLESIHRCLYK